MEWRTSVRESANIKDSKRGCSTTVFWRKWRYEEVQAKSFIQLLQILILHAYYTINLRCE